MQREQGGDGARMTKRNCAMKRRVPFRNGKELCAPEIAHAIEAARAVLRDRERDVEKEQLKYIIYCQSFKAYRQC